MRKHTLILSLFLVLILSSCTTSSSFVNNLFNHQPPPRAGSPASQLENPVFWQASPEAIWAKVQQIPYTKLEESQNISDPTAAAWVKLATISKRDSVNTTQLVQNLMAWRHDYPHHPGNRFFPDNTILAQLLNNTAPKRIALLIPLKGPLASSGEAVRDGFMGAYFEELGKTNYAQTITFYDTTQNKKITALYQEALAKGTDMIIGPLTKEDVKQLMMMGSFPVPTIALNYTDLWFGKLPTNLYQFGLSPLDEAKQIADKAWQAGLSKAIIIAPKNEWGLHLAKALSTHWQANGGKVSDVYYFAADANLTAEIARLLHINTTEDRKKTRDENENDKTTLSKQRRQDFDTIFLLASPEKAREIVPLLRFYYVNDTPIYSNSTIYSGIPQAEKDNDLNGVIFCDIPWILNIAASPESHEKVNELFAVGHDAYFISHDLNRMITLANFPAYGFTGSLTLIPTQQFYRRLPWAQFHDGHP